MVEFDEALRIILGNIDPLPLEEAKLLDSLDRFKDAWAGTIYEKGGGCYIRGRHKEEKRF